MRLLLSLLKYGRVEADIVGQVVHNVDFDHIAGLHVEAGLGGADLVEIGFVYV